MAGEYPYIDEPTHVQGTVAAAPRSTATSGSSQEDRAKVDVVDKLFVNEPRKHPLIQLLTFNGTTLNGEKWEGDLLSKAPAVNTTFGWFEKSYGGRYSKVNAAYNNTDAPVTITVSGSGTSPAYIFTKGDIIMNFRTGEHMKVASVASATTITATRSVGTTAATAGIIGDGIYIVGNANEENATARNVNSTKASKETNHTQIFRTSISVSNSEKNTDAYGGNDLKVERAIKGTEHLLDIERAFMFGEKNDGTGDSSLPERTTGGIKELIEGGNSYIQNQAGPLTAPDLDTFLREGFTYGDGVKTLFCGGPTLSAINEIARGQIQTKVGDTSYGLSISEWESAHGVVKIIRHPLLVQDFAGYAFLLDLNCFRYRHLQNRDTTLETNIQANGTDGQVDQYITESGLERKQAAYHAMLKGVQA